MRIDRDSENIYIYIHVDKLLLTFSYFHGTVWSLFTLNCLTHSTLSYSLLNTLSPCLCLGWSASLQLGSYPDIHTDAAADRQFSNIPHSCRSSHGPWTQPALPHPMGSWEHRRKGEHWCVRHTEHSISTAEVDHVHIFFIWTFYK